jgi:hypothetical protein
LLFILFDRLIPPLIGASSDIEGNFSYQGASRYDIFFYLPFFLSLSVHRPCLYLFEREYLHEGVTYWRIYRLINHATDANWEVKQTKY